MMRALSISPFADRIVRGPRQTGCALGRGHILVGDVVITLTRPGTPRMPNGVETALVLEAGEAVIVGCGAISARDGIVEPRAVWNPRPKPRFTVSASPRLTGLIELAGRGPGLTPLGDDILVGFLASRALAGASRSGLRSLAGRAGARTTALSRTLLLTSAEGHLPEPAIWLLEQGDIESLRTYGATSGSGLLVGLGLHHERREGPPARTLTVTLPLAEPLLVDVRIQTLARREAA